MHTKFLSESLKVKRTRGRYRCRLDDDINMQLRVIRYEGVDWIELARDVAHLRTFVTKVTSISELF